jgi:hypothetical protein
MAPHLTQVEISPPLPLEIEAGADISLRVKVSCPEGCDLRGIPVTVMAADGVLVTSELATCDETTNETADVATMAEARWRVALQAPGRVGEHVWTVVFPRHENEGAVHEEACRVASVTIRPHTTSMAVWDVPSPVIVNRSFKVKVGVKCSATCQLAGRPIEVCDETGIRIGEGRLGETPWPGTSALYVAEAELPAPPSEGMSLWFARFPASEPGLPHEEAAATFSFRTDRPPEHRVTVKVTDRETHAPLESVEVRLGVYRASTDAHGLAHLELPGGRYELDARKSGYATAPKTVDVGRDLMLHVEAALAPEKDPDDERVWM